MSESFDEYKFVGLTIADFDLMWCQRYLLAYLELLKQPVGSEDPWKQLLLTEAESDQNPIDILARSLATSIVISYSRPWSNNRDAGGHRNKLAKNIFKDMHGAGNQRGTDKPLFPFNQDVHKRVLAARDQVVAHSDHAKWEMQIDREPHGSTTSGKDPFEYLAESEAQELLENTKSLRSMVNSKKRK